MKYEEIPYYTSGIYKINFYDTDKCYIGLSNNIRRRMTEHLRKDIRDHPELPISKAIIKHGVKDIEILEYISSDNREELCEREKYWIKYYKSLVSENGYNVSLGGDGADTGINNNASKLTDYQLEEIINLLKNTKLSLSDIAHRFNINRVTVSDINSGKHYYNNQINYPIRPQKIVKEGLDSPFSSFYNNIEKLYELIDTIKTHPELTLEQIAKQYQISTSLITQINNGKSNRIETEEYPIRKNSSAHKKYFSLEKLNQIYDDLKNSSLTMTDIGKKFSCGREIISEINKGKRQPQKNQTYPIRISRKGIKSLS